MDCCNDDPNKCDECKTCQCPHCKQERLISTICKINDCGVCYLNEEEQDKLNPCNPNDHDWHTSFCDHPEHTTFCFNCERCFKENQK